MEYITYEMFGAAGDGVTDDMPAIAAAHADANAKGLPVRVKKGVVYYISPKALTAVVRTDTDWTGAEFIIDDRDCEHRGASLFVLPPAADPVELSVSALRRGQTRVDNPTGEDLYVLVTNENHKDYIRRGLNRNNGTARKDNFLLYADGTLPSPVSFDFERVTSVTALPQPKTTLTLCGGTFTTIANREESKYNYHSRNISIHRSKTEVYGLTHLVTGEGDHGAPYAGFLSVSSCADVYVHDCVFTGHYTYKTIGTGGEPVPMGSYDISLGSAANVTFARCSQTTDIHDRRYWGLIGTNFCRDLVFEDCCFSRFDAHQGVTNCVLRRCTLGWQCLNAIGSGTFLIENTAAHGYALVNLRSDYGSTWDGKIIIRDSTWYPLGSGRAVFAAHNDGTHDFGYTCRLPREVEIDGLTVADENGDTPLYIFNDYNGSADIPETDRLYKLIPPREVRVKNIHTARPVQLCANMALMPETSFTAE